MSNSVAAASSILRAALFATTALCLLGSGAAFARVGVTSATDGDPLGKPPAEAERVLRIGIDVQANEVIRTGANDRAHLVFLDGTALTVGPNAQLTIDKFVYDPNTKTGELAVNATKGVLRLVGGRISKTRDIVITTPSSTIGVRGGITLIEILLNKTASTFIFGGHMTVSGQGQTQTATRPGTQVTVIFGAVPGTPIMAPPGSLGSMFSQLEGSQNPGPNASPSTGGTAILSPAVIVNGTQMLASQPAQQVASSQVPMPVFMSPQQWNPAPNFASGVTNPGALPGNNPLPSTFTLPNTGSATYAGNFAGLVSGSNTPFSGTFSINWSFASQTGNLTASNNNALATAPLALIPRSVVFTGPLTVAPNFGGTTGGTGTVVGVFSSTSSVIGGFTGTSTTGGIPFSGGFSGSKR